MKLFPFYRTSRFLVLSFRTSYGEELTGVANPPECEDWHVPIALVDFGALKDDNWDITAARVSQHIDGVNHVGRIAQLADADPALVRETLRHMLFYQVIMVVRLLRHQSSLGSPGVLPGQGSRACSECRNGASIAVHVAYSGCAIH